MHDLPVRTTTYCDRRRTARLHTRQSKKTFPFPSGLPLPLPMPVDPPVPFSGPTVYPPDPSASRAGG